LLHTAPVDDQTGGGWGSYNFSVHPAQSETAARTASAQSIGPAFNPINV
jgi:hypothetical protein